MPRIPGLFMFMVFVNIILPGAAVAGPAFIGWGGGPGSPDTLVMLGPLLAIAAAVVGAAAIVAAGRQIRHLRERVRREHQQARALADAVPGWAFLLSETGKVTWLSRTSEDLTGYPVDEAKAMERYPMDLVDPEDADRVRRVLQPSDPGETASLHAGGPEVFRFRTKSGDIRTGIIACSRVFDPLSGRLGDRLCVVFDVTDVLPLVGHDAARYYHLFLNLPDAFVAVDMEGRLLEWNASFEAMLGYSGEELRNLRLSDITPAEDMNQERRILADQVLAQGFSQPYERRFIARNGAHIPVDMRVQLIRKSDGSAAGFWALIRDIRERRRTEAARREVEQRLQEVQRLQAMTCVAAGVARQFNNHLMVVIGNVQELRTSADLPAHLQERVEEIREAARQAAALCRQLSAYAGGGLRRDRIDVSRLLRDKQALLRAVVGDRIVLRLETPGHLPAVEADGAQLFQAVMNLIANAVEAIGDQEGVVVIRAGACQWTGSETQHCYPRGGIAPGDYVFIEVADSGPGIDPDDIPQLFEPFTSTRAPGRGLGLPAVLGIARSHDGAVYVDSLPGQGARFRILLPVCPESSTDETGSAPPRSASALEGCRILIVEDEETIRTILARVFRRAGCYLLLAETGEEAQRILRKRAGELDCILVDLILGEVSGTDVISEARRLRPDLPVVAMSGHGEAETISKLEGQRPDGFLQKPASPDQIIGLVQRVLRTRHARSGSDAAARNGGGEKGSP